ncbi:SH3 domain-containing protein [Devosia ginsengisoli]|uniref:SH3 domain-containing protein n=1 Tax=Devosia ginsengisoli TaxID=400770 RepID=A0A5B8LRZ6_9HYPH|nr:SH3 domain-containing protein [Devosia ginsengisoli]QDZ10050.1 SH3 domain-containing protein [Devosia ginsengisoli]
MSHFLFRTRTVAILLPVLALCAISVPTAASEIAACTISAWSNDTDPNGLNIRAGAGSDTAIIGQIPVGGEVSITGAKDGWFRIDQAVLIDYESDETTDVFAGEGWVSGRMLGLVLHDDLHAAPSDDSPVVARLFHEDAEGNIGGADSFGVSRILTCQGDWVQVEGTFFDTPLTGWATRTCSNQVTTCS